MYIIFGFCKGATFASKQEDFAFGDSKIYSGLFQSTFKYDLEFACPLAYENSTFNFGGLKMLNYRPFLVLIYQYDFGVFMPPPLHKKILQFTPKSA